MKGFTITKYLHHCWGLVFFLFFHLSLLSEPIEVINETSYPLGKFIYYFEDKSNEISFSDVLAGKYEANFEKSRSESPNFGFKDSSYWAKIEIENKGLPQKDFFIEQAFPPIDFFEIYYQENSDWKNIQLGDSFPFYHRIYTHRNFIIPVEIPTHTKKTFYFKMKTKSVSVFRLILYSTEAFHTRTEEYNFFYGFFYGILIILFIKNIFLFIILREKIYSYYVLFVFGIGMYFWVFNGFAFQYFWPNQMNWNDLSNPFFMTLAIFGAAKTSIHFLDIVHYSPRARIVMDALAYLTLLNTLFVFIFPYKYVLYYLYIMITPVAVSIFIAAIISYLRKNPMAKFFLTGYISLIVSAFLVALNNLGIRSSYASPDLLQGASCFAICILSLGLSNRYYVLRQQKLELESKAFQINTRLNRIENELEIAKKIHESLLPSVVSERLNLRLSAKYISSSEISGDFYDFHSLEGKHLGVFIADVTGHGVPAALFSSIVKFAFSREWENMKEPSRLLSNMNTSLFEKIGNNLLSAGYLYIDQISRRITYASCGHPPLLIWKKEDKEFIELKPKGRLIGISREIVLFDSILKLEEGDRILFYTDGLWECENEKGIPFGETALQRFTAEKENLKAEEFANSLIETLQDYSKSSGNFSDDVTFIVIDIL